ncbi:MAG TPA: HEAT repeat domain-containing protein [Candidatus Binatia bacterium]|nr:HEAT repeat domain-containing protein [Candidatus Binatia bacterium]
MDKKTNPIARLLASLDHHDKKIVREAVDALVALAPDAPEVRVEVEEAMARAPAYKRWPMAYVLAQIAPPSDACFAALEAGLDAPDPDIRWAIVVLFTALARRQSGATQERLASLANTGTATQRRMAVYALRDIGAQDAVTERAVIAALGDSGPLVRIAALTSLKAFPDTARALIADMQRMLESDDDARVRAAAAVALAQSGGPMAEIRGALEGAALSGDPTVVRAARAALEMLGRKAT